MRSSTEGLRVRRIVHFIGVGSAAAAVHFVVVIAGVQGLDFHPLLANVWGWLVAFLVSFAGHHRLTFADQDAPIWQAMRRFFLISAAGFAVNEGLYALTLILGGMDYRAALFLVLLAVAVLTYLVSKAWAFAGRQR
jgi:putative flippase GtrA